jgi:viroplasmin and RNaseH domain-containing protein
MAWYVVHVGHVSRIYRTWEDCHAQVKSLPWQFAQKIQYKSLSFEGLL